MKTVPVADFEENEDELQDQLAESLFQEADKMGIFESNDGVDYGEALKKVEKEIAKV